MSNYTCYYFINHIWYSTSLFYIIILPLAWLYGFINFVIRFSYWIGLCKVHRFPLPILIVGNITIGGTGKTPLVLFIVNKLQHRGWRVGVVTRGYGGSSKHYPFLIDSSINSNQCGDEPLLIWQRTGAPVAVARRRIDAVALLIQSKKLDIIVADDGLQHYALARDIELVVIDGVRRFGNGCLLPAGPMRERATRLNSVNGVIVNGGEVYQGEISMLLQPGAAINLLTGERRTVSELSTVVVIAGIGNPKRFFATIRACGITPIKEVIFADHKRYREEMLTTLITGNENLLMTEKDAVKCSEFAHSNWWYLQVEALLLPTVSEQLLINIESIIRKYKINKIKNL